jgi:hypothetical protein
MTDIIWHPDQPEILFGPLLIKAMPESEPPFIVDAAVVEEDTFLIMSSDVEIGEINIDMKELKRRIEGFEPVSPGTVIAQETTPLKMCAVVYDFDLDPSWKEEWVAQALEEILREAEAREIASLALPLLGTIHGHMKKKRFAEILCSALKRSSLKYLKNLWIVVKDGSSSEFLEMLKSAENGESY